MGFSLRLDEFLDLVPTTPSEPEGLDLAIEAIDTVISQIETEMKDLIPTSFASVATIQKSSFGGADSAPNLALRYTRAHEVTSKTLLGLKEDLVKFQDACRNAKNQIVVADEAAADEHNRTRSAVDTLEAGASSHQGSYAHRQAQQNQDTTGGGDH